MRGEWGGVGVLWEAIITDSEGTKPRENQGATLRGDGTRITYRNGWDGGAAEAIVLKQGERRLRGRARDGREDCRILVAAVAIAGTGSCGMKELLGGAGKL